MSLTYEEYCTQLLATKRKKRGGGTITPCTKAQWEFRNICAKIVGFRPQHTDRIKNGKRLKFYDPKVSHNKFMDHANKLAKAFAEWPDYKIRFQVFSGGGGCEFEPWNSVCLLAYIVDGNDH